MSISQINLTSIVPFTTNFSNSSSSSSHNSTSLHSSPIDRVPKVVLNHIFSYLSLENLGKMSLVSLRVKNLSELPSLWIPHCPALQIHINPKENKNAKSSVAKEWIKKELEKEIHGDLKQGITGNSDQLKISTLLRNFLLLGGNPEDRVNEPIFKTVYENIYTVNQNEKAYERSKDSFEGKFRSINLEKENLDKKNFEETRKNLEACLDIILNYPGFNWCEASRKEDHTVMDGMNPSSCMCKINHKILSTTVITDQDSLNRYLHFAFNNKDLLLVKELVKKGASLSSTIPYKRPTSYGFKNPNFPEGSPQSLMLVVLDSHHSAQGNQIELAELLVGDFVNKIAKTIFENCPDATLLLPLASIVAHYYGAKPLFSGSDIEFACDNCCYGFLSTSPGEFFVNRCLILALKHNQSLADFIGSSNKTLLERAETGRNTELVAAIKELKTPPWQNLISKS